MPDKKITDLVDGAPLQPTDEFVVARAGDNFKIDGAEVVAAVTKHDVTIGGNTAGAGALISSGTMTLAGGNNITLSQAGNAVTISGAAAGGAQTAISGLANSQTTYTSGTVSLSEQGALTIRSTTGQQFQFSVPNTSSLSATGIVSLSANGSTISVGAPGYSAGISTLGNTSGDTGYASQRLNLVGGNNITLSGSTNGGSMSLTISGAAAAGAQTAISGIAASNTTYTSGTVTITGVGGGVTVSSNTGQRIDISVAAQSVQPETQTFIAGIQNSQTTYTSGTVNLSVVAGNLTIRSTTGQAFQFSASQTVQPETQTFVGGIAASNTTYTSGTVTFTGVGGGITVSSNTGQRVDLSVAAQSVQTQGILSAGVSTGGNTSGNTQVSTGSRLVFVGSNNITLSQGTAAGATTVTISGPSVAGAQTGISGVANSQTTYTSGTVSLSELGAITIRSTTGQQYQFSVPNTSSLSATGIVSLSANGSTISVGAPGYSGGMSTLGNTSGDTGYASQRLNLVGGNNITLSGSSNGGSMSITISGAVAGGAQTAISGLANSQTTYTSGTVSLSELGAITIRSTTGNQFQFSVNAQSVQTQSLIQALYDGANSITTGTVRLTNANGVTFSINAQTLSASVNESISMFAVSNTTQSTSGTAHKSALSFGGAGIASVGVTGGSVVVSVPAGAGQTGISGIANSQTTYTSGTVSLSELGAITIRSTTGNQFQFSVNAQTTQTQGILSAGVSTGGNTAGNTQVSTGSRLVFVGTNNITLSQGTAAGATTITVSGPTTAAQSVQTQGILNVALSNVGNTAGDTGINSGTRYVLAGGNNITLSGSSAANATTVTISAASQSVQTQGILSAGVSNVGNSSGNTTVNTGSRLVFAGGNNITLSQSTAAGATTITVSAPNLGAGAFSGGASNLGNTAGDTGITGTRLIMVGSDNITLSQATDANGGTLSFIGGGGGGFSAGASDLGNTAGATGVTGTQLVFVGSNNITLSQTTGANGGTISILAPASSSFSATGAIELSTNGSTISIGDGAGTLPFWDNLVPGASTTFSYPNATLNIYPLNPANAGFPGYMSVSSVFFDVSATVSTGAAFSRSFSLGFYTQVNSTQLSLLASASTSIGTGAAAAGITNSYGGRRWLTIHSSQFNNAPNFAGHSDYYFAVWERSSSGSQTITYQGMLLPYATGVRSGIMGAASSANTTLGNYPFLGNYSVSFSTAMPNALAASDVNKSNATAISMPRMIFNNVGSNII